MDETIEHDDDMLLDDKGRERVRGEAETAPEFVSRWHKRPQASDSPTTIVHPAQSVRRAYRLTRDETEDY